MHDRRRTSGVFYGHMESHKVVILLIAIKKNYRIRMTTKVSPQYYDNIMLISWFAMLIIRI
jgi:hypothetical protein